MGASADRSRNAARWCPFCEPHGEEVFLAENEHAYAVCDARPAVEGHVLIISKAHAESIRDLEPTAYAGFRLVQQRLATRVRAAYGEVGVYEHGRSALCRFHDQDRFNTHAHAHVLPVSFDLVGISGCRIKWHADTAHRSLPGGRYLYQETDELGRPREVWGAGECKVPRHFVRSVLDKELEARGVRRNALRAPGYVHADAIDRTISALAIPARPPDERSLIIASSNIVRARRVATRVSGRLSLPVLDLSLIGRSATIPLEGDGEWRTSFAALRRTSGSAGRARAYDDIPEHVAKSIEEGEADILGDALALEVGTSSVSSGADPTHARHPGKHTNSLMEEAAVIVATPAQVDNELAAFDGTCVTLHTATGSGASASDQQRQWQGSWRGVRADSYVVEGDADADFAVQEYRTRASP